MAKFSATSKAIPPDSHCPPNASILYSTLAKGPKLSHEDQINSSRHFMRELNRFGVTSPIDAGGGFHNYPDDYEVIDELHNGAK